MSPSDALRIVVMVVAMLLFVAPATAFGYMTGTTTQTATPGSTASFTVYIAAERTVTAAVTKQPEGWKSTVDPDTITESTTAGARYVAAGNGYTQVIPVETSVEIPETAVSGTHTVTTTFSQEASGDGDGAVVAVSQTQDVSFTIKVANGSTSSIEEPGESGNKDGAEGSGGSGGTGDSTGSGGGGGGFFQQARDVLGVEDDDTGGDDEAQEPSDDEERETDRKLIPSSNDTGTVDEPAEDDSASDDAGATGLLTGLPSSAVIAFELLWVVVVGYLLYRRR